MLDYTIELISLAASNSLAVFCFCNLIIAILLVGSSSKTSQSPSPNPIPQFDEQEKNPNGIPTIANAQKCSKKLEAYLSEEANEGKVASSVSIDMVEEDEDDDELKKRVEEFIEKINSAWRDEKIKTRLSLGQQLSLDQ